MTRLMDPDAIYRQSFATIRGEVDLSGLPAAVRPLALRLIHACGMTDILADLVIDAGLPEAVRAGLAAGAPILADCEMVKAAISRRFLPAGAAVTCTLNAPAAAAIGKANTITRSAAAVDLWRPHLAGAVVVIGNAPTALFALIDLIDAGGPRPAAIIAFPVGFVGAVESKAELAANPRAIPIATLKGRRGGSAMAAACFNAIFARQP
jgi:precorrin-8X/cobalt-precorrin-8 methylmutase